MNQEELETLNFDINNKLFDWLYGMCECEYPNSGYQVDSSDVGELKDGLVELFKDKLSSNKKTTQGDKNE